MKLFHTHELILDAVERRVIPGAAYAVGRGDEVYAKESVGYRSLFPAREALTPDTRFDMASLSKVLSTTMVALRFLEEGRMLLSDPLSRFFTEEELAGAPDGRAGVTVFHLMTHTSGITPHIALWNAIPPSVAGTPQFPSEAAKVILRSAPFCEVGGQVHYSCMGYILLQQILERISGRSLDRLAQDCVFEPLGMTATGYLPFGDNQNKPACDAAATELSALHGYYIRGHVHDENAHFLGGISGNAGVFSTLEDMVTFAQMLSLRGAFPAAVTEKRRLFAPVNGQENGAVRFLSKRIFDLAVQDYTKGKNESRGLGFQLRPPLPALSAAGDLFGYGSYGHTGFTGTSLYVDAETGIWAVLLTNAVHLGRDKTEFFRVRRLFHNAVMGDLG
jgi:CubicO group peptidase (beta-lactamase class C family)